MGTPLLLITAGVETLSSAIILSYLAILWRGAQSVIINRGVRCSNNFNKYKEV